MIVTEFSRDLLMVGAIFGVAAFIWAGMAHERPPKQLIWRLALIVLQIAAVVLAVVGFSSALRGWDELSAFDVGGTAVTAYIVTYWVEVAVIIALSIWAYRRKRGDLIARSSWPWWVATSSRWRGCSASRFSS